MVSATTYDIAIIGAGVCGAAIARTLSAFRTEIVLLEKCADVGFGVSKANSGIIHAGFHHTPGTLKARLEVQGNLLFDSLHYELGFPFKRVGILVVAFCEEEMKTVQHLYEQGRENGVQGLEICNAQRLLAMEPKLNPDAVGGLYAPSGGIIEPYRFVFALTECAHLNGATIRTGFEVERATYERGIHTIHSTTGEKVRARFVVNAAGLYADTVSKIFHAESYTIKPRKGEEFLLDRNAEAHPRQVLFPVPVKNSKGILVIPTVEGTTMIGPTAQDVTEKEDTSTTRENLETVFTSAKHMMPSISRRDVITSFAGVRPVLDTGDFYIQNSRKTPRFIHVAGIQSPGLTASPAIAEYVKELLKKAGLKLTEKTEFKPHIHSCACVREQTPHAMASLIEHNRMYGNIVCRCETVSEAEIVEAIRKGHTTLDGIKFYTRSGMGRCQGGFCTYKILKILARETGCAIPSLSKRSDGSYIVNRRIGTSGRRKPKGRTGRHISS